MWERVEHLDVRTDVSEQIKREESSRGGIMEFQPGEVSSPSSPFETATEKIPSSGQSSRAGLKAVKRERETEHSMKVRKR